MRVIDDGEHGDERGDLDALKEAAALNGGHGDAVLAEDAPVHAADGVGGAEENGDVPILKGALPAAGRDGRPGGDKRIYLPGDKLGLKSGLIRAVLVLALGHGEEHKLRLRDRRWVLCPAAESRRVVIVHVAQGAGHAQGEHAVRPIENFTPGAEILAQQDAARLGGFRGLIVGIAQVFLGEDGGVGKAETVNGLLDVPDHEEVLPGSRHGVEDRVLHAADVLILIDHDLGKAAGDARCRLGRAAVGVREQLRGKVLKVGIVYQAATALILGILAVKVKGDLEQRLHCGGGELHLAQERGGIGIERILHAVHRLFAGGAPRFEHI